MDAHVKAGLLKLAAHARSECGWSLRRAAAVLGVEHTRLGRWAVRATTRGLEDATPGPEVPVHALLDWERAAIVKLAEEWGEIDRSHGKLAHRGWCTPASPGCCGCSSPRLCTCPAGRRASHVRSGRSRSGPSWYPA